MATVIEFTTVSECQICGIARESMTIDDWQIIEEFIEHEGLDPDETTRGLRVNQCTASYTHGGMVTSDLLHDPRDPGRDMARDLTTWHLDTYGEPLSLRYSDTPEAAATICRNCARDL